MGPQTRRQPQELKSLVLRILDENHTMAVATVRPDGWPQATMVGFAYDDLTIYFLVARQSQKLANLKRDPRVSIAMGYPSDPRSVRGLSLAALVEEVETLAEIQRLNDILARRYPQVAVFAPREASAALLRARPHILSLVDEGEGLVDPVLMKVISRTELIPVD